MKLVEIKYAYNMKLLAFLGVVVAFFSLFISHLRKLILAAIFLFVIVSANAQKDYTISTQPTLLNTISLGTLGASDKPEFVASSSVISFSVPTATGAGAGFFEWMVLGGRITGGSVDMESGHQASYLKKDNLATDTKSTIEITWERNNYEDAWIAVRQTSEFGCTDGKWSIYYVRIVNLEAARIMWQEIVDACKGSDMDLKFVVTGVDAALISSLSVDVTYNLRSTFTVNYTDFLTHPVYVHKLSTTTLLANAYNFSLSNFKILLKNSNVPVVKPADFGIKTGTVFALPPPRVIEHN